MSDIAKGDMVRLKSGGPNMMVDDIGEASMMGEASGDVRVWCEWFDDKKVAQRKDFALTSVEKVAPSSNAPYLAGRGAKVV